MLSKPSLTALSAVALAASAILIGATSAAPAFATTSTATYGEWSSPIEVVAGNHYTGTISFGTSGISSATYDTTYAETDASNRVELRDSSSEWLSPQTPFGAVFGASGPSTTTNFLKDYAQTTETTVITFETAVPANRLGIAVGDLDYDTVVFTATDSTTTALTGTQLVGSSSDNNFNLCNVTDSLPDSCPGVVTTIPTMNLNANDVTFNPNTTSDGHNGVTGWIYPSGEIKSLTLTHSTFVTGMTIRIWMAAIDDAAPVVEPTVEPSLANTAAPEAGPALWIALALGLLGMGGLVAANRRKVNA